MQNINEPASEQEIQCLSPLAWLFFAGALLPHVLVLAGQEVMAFGASAIFFPLTMGPFAVVHMVLLVNRLGFLSHMAWISALIFSMIWFALVCWSWRKDRTLTIGLWCLCFIVSCGWIWQRIIPAA